MNVERFFGTPIAMIDELISKEYHMEVVDRLLQLQQQTEEKEKGWVCDVYSTHNTFDLQQDSFFNDFLIAQTEKVYEFAHELTNEKGKPAKLLNSWFNVSDKHQYQDQHIHTNSHISSVYYAKAPEGSAPTIFKSPYVDMYSFGSSQYNDITVPPKERSLLIFCSNTPHLTGKQNIDAERITVASNYLIGA